MLIRFCHIILCLMFVIDLFRNVCYIIWSSMFLCYALVRFYDCFFLKVLIYVCRGKWYFGRFILLLLIGGFCTLSSFISSEKG